MGRPTKNTVDYFPHSCNHKKTIFILEQRYGNDGYAFWFKLLELLGSTEKHFINCNNKSDWKFLQAKMYLTEEKCLEILNLLVELDAIDKELWSKKIIWCQNFIDNISDVYKNRRVETPTKPLFYKDKLQEKRVSTKINPPSKEKKVISTGIKRQSKVKESKGGSPDKKTIGVNPPKKSNKKKKDWRSTPEFYLAHNLGEAILINKPKYKKVLDEKEKNYENWCVDIHKLLKWLKKNDEPIDYGKMSELIDWSIGINQYWSGRIKTGKSFADNYQDLMEEYTRKKGGSGYKKDKDGEIVEDAFPGDVVFKESPPTDAIKRYIEFPYELEYLGDNETARNSFLEDIKKRLGKEFEKWYESCRDKIGGHIEE